jgi:acyl-CoA hydrolase
LVGIYLDEATITNTPSIITRNKNVVAINSALQVDITGQVCADSIGLRMISGVGGTILGNNNRSMCFVIH